MSKFMRRSLPMAALGAFALLAVAGLPVQAQQDTQQQPEQQQPAAQVDEEMIKSFAEASLQVEELNNKWAPRIAQAEGQDQVQKLREQATTELTEAVRSSGLTVEDYNRIYRAAQQDQKLASQIQQYRQEMAN